MTSWALVNNSVKVFFIKIADFLTTMAVKIVERRNIILYWKLLNSSRQHFQHIWTYSFHLLMLYIKPTFLKKWAIPGPFFVYFWSFQTNTYTIFTTNQCEKMPMPSSIPCRDLNPWPLDHESSPITTRPGLPPTSNLLCRHMMDIVVPRYTHTYPAISFKFKMIFVIMWT